jgi:thiazole synthase ThiGH ThiG subunit
MSKKTNNQPIVSLATRELEVYHMLAKGMKTSEIALDAGADTFVVGSAVFNAPDPAAMVVSLREFATACGNK